MNEILELMKDLIAKGMVRISVHGYDELAADNISVRNVISGMQNADLLEDYPSFAKGPCVLVLQRDQEDRPIHVVWGIAKGTKSPAVLITAYRPDPEKWTEDYRSRK